MYIIINIVKIVFLLGFLIFIHEGGHCLAAKKFGVRVEEFSIGFGKKIITKKKGETVYSLGIIPFGGYCKMTGETEYVKDDPKAFNNAKTINKILICLAGPLVNIVFALIVYFILAFVSQYNISTTVAEISKDAMDLNTPLEVGDTILYINDEKIRLKSDITDALLDTDGKEVKVIVNRNGEEKTLYLIPVDYGAYYGLGIKVALLETDSLRERFYYSFWETVDFSMSIYDSLVWLISGRAGFDQLSGPVGISEVVAQTQDLYEFIYYLALISLSLGVTNLLPIPALDGGRILVYIIELIRRKPISQELEVEIQTVGFTFLIMLSIYVTYNDVIRLFK